MESRACLSTILSYAYCYEDAQILCRRLCKKGQVFVDKDESSMLKSMCVPREKLKVPKDEQENKSNATSAKMRVVTQRTLQSQRQVANIVRKQIRTA